METTPSAVMAFQDLTFDGVRALIRVDFNVPMSKPAEDGSRTVTDDTRIRAALPTIQHVLDTGGSVVLMSHLGRPKGADADLSLRHIISTLEGHLGRPVKFAADCVGDEALEVTQALAAGEVAVLENLRFHGEEKAGDEFFAGQLAENGDFYINDAFGTAHRAHASTAVIAKFLPGGQGVRLPDGGRGQGAGAGARWGREAGGGRDWWRQGELQAGRAAEPAGSRRQAGHRRRHGVHLRAGPRRPGRWLAGRARHARRRVGPPRGGQGQGNFRPPAHRHAVRRDGFFAGTPTSRPDRMNAIPDGWEGMDIGPESRADFAAALADCKTILWNGPMGVFEFDRFAEGTNHIAQAIVRRRRRGVHRRRRRFCRGRQQGRLGRQGELRLHRRQAPCWKA